MLKEIIRKTALILTLILIFSTVAGCGNSVTQSSKQPINSDTTKTNANSSQTTYPLKIKDGSNTDVTIPSKPMRIVSFVPSSTETLFALGLEGRITAVTKYDDYPVDIQKKVEYSFDDSLHPNVEQLLKLNPDLIVLGMHDEKTISSIKDLKIPVVVFNPQSLSAVYDTIKSFGVITDSQAQAQKIIDEMKSKEQLIAQKVAAVKPENQLRVWVEVDPSLFTAGQGTFMDELLTKAGGKNIASEINGWGQYSEEKVIAKNPQVIFDTYSYYVKDVQTQILSRPGWKNIDAVKNKKVFDLDSNLVNRPGPRIIDGIESMAKALYPDQFK